VNHKDLEVWKQSIELAKAVYDLTRNFPSSEMYGLTSQMRRSAVSIPSNIAEGRGKKS
jgi:four helix bundle protein